MAFNPTTLPVSYTTVDDVFTAIPTIGSVTNVTSGVVAVTAGRVEAKINGKLSKSFAMPISVASGNTIPLLNAIATDLVCYELMAKFVFVQGMAKKSDWPDRFKEAMDLLDDIVDGAIPLLDSSAAIVSPATGAASIPWSNTDDYFPTMQEDSFVNHIIDEDKLDDIEDDRD